VGRSVGIVDHSEPEPEGWCEESKGIFRLPHRSVGIIRVSLGANRATE